VAVIFGVAIVKSMLLSRWIGGAGVIVGAISIIAGIEVAYVAFGDTNNNNNISNGIFFMKSLDSGNSFSDTIKLNSNWNSIRESQIAAYRNDVYVVWGGNPDERL
jgi:hypothetical protein